MVLTFKTDTQLFYKHRLFGQFSAYKSLCHLQGKFQGKLFATPGIWPLILVLMLCNSEDRGNYHLQYCKHLWQIHVWTEIQLMMLFLTLLSP